jgi:signal transduction histidine kinase
MAGVSQKRFHETVQEPGAESLEILAKHSTEVVRCWHAGLRKIGLDEHTLIPEGVDFADWSERLRSVSYTSFRQYLRRLGGVLVPRCGSLEKAAAALNRLFEACLPFLDGESPKRAGRILALARLHSLVGLLLLSGAKGKASDRETLAEASLAEGDERHRDASLYISRIYEQERMRLAQDLHDEVGHDLILVKLYLEMMVLETKDCEQAQPRLAEAIALVSHAIDSVRRLGLDLGPAIFDDLGFLPAVKFYISQFSARTKIPVSLREGYVPEDIPMTHQAALYRLLQGALSNVLQHAKAKHVSVTLGSVNGSMLFMVIQDDGLGFNATKGQRRRSFGLTAMKDRVEMLGGKIQFKSPAARGRGTRIEVDLPLHGSEVPSEPQ